MTELERTQAGAELAAYLWGVLITVGSKRRDVIYALVRSGIEDIEAEATAAAEQRLAGLVRALRSAIGVAHSFGPMHGEGTTRQCADPICRQANTVLNQLRDTGPEVIEATEDAIANHVAVDKFHRGE